MPARSAIGDAWPGVAGEGFEVVAAARHRRKLKRGALKGNDFTIVLRDFSGDAQALEQRLRSVATAGVPNYFGPQRFGRDAGNLRTALAWFSEGVAPADRWQRGFALSAARAAIFNAVVAQRVGDGTWNRLLPGEIVNLDGSGSVFVADSGRRGAAKSVARSSTFIPRVRCGAAPASAAGAARGTRGATLARVTRRSRGDSAVQGCSRNAVRCASASIVSSGPSTREVVQLRFRLLRGAFATAVLHELIDNAFAQQAPETDE